MKKEHLLIIGNSGAAINAVKGIRRVNPRCPITLLSKEPRDAYSPVLTTYLIAGKVAADRMGCVDKGFYERYGVETRYGQRVVSVDTARKKVFLQTGDAVDYDKLLIATGAVPNPLDVPLTGKVKVHTLRTIDDAEAIRSAQGAWKKVIFVGAGLVSVQVANALRAHVGEMVFIVGSDRILSQNFDAKASGMVQRRIEAEGGKFLFNRTVIGVEKSRTGVMALLGGGKTITADAIFVGKGVHPNIPGIAPDGAVKVGRGIRVDSRMRTSAEGIFAAGDVCEAADLLSGEYRVVSNWPNACFQGWVAGQNMGGGDALFEGSLSMNVTSVFGLSVASVGQVRDHNGCEREAASCTYESREVYKKWVFRDDRLIGGIMVGDIGDNALVAEIIRRRIRMPKEKEALISQPWNAAGLLCRLLLAR